MSKKSNNEKSNRTSKEAKTMTRNTEIDLRTWRVWGLYGAILNYFSLASGTTTVCLSETLIDRKTFDPNKAHEGAPVVSDKDFEAVMMALNSLTEKEKTILVLRFGLDYGTPRTLEEVGKMLGVTRERIRQLEAKALRKMRSPSSLCKLPALFGFIPPMTPVEDGYLVDEYGRMDPHSKIEDLGLTVRAHNCLKRFAHIDTIDDILDYPKEDWPKVRNLGRKALEEVVEKMHFAGYEDFSVNVPSEI